MIHRLAGRVIVITGGSSGIGAATAVACAAAGMTVVLGSRREDRMRQVQRHCEQVGAATGGCADTVLCDVRDHAQVTALVEGACSRHGRLDALFANAGYDLFASIADTSEAQVRDIFETNFFGTLYALWAAIPLMRKQGHGHLLICSSAVSEIGLPKYGAYAATKAAQDAVACALRAEVADENIAVSSVHPVGTRSAFFEVVREVSQAGGQVDTTPPALSQTPEQVARAVVKCLRRPRAEVWPCRSVRFGLAMTTAFPEFAAWAMRRLQRRRAGNAK
jgi:NADP-dependent 3-hydroxy acid dehydrogenase YdfG